MITKARWFLPVVLAVVCAGGIARSDDKEKVTGDLKKMQGAWTHTNSNGDEDRWTFEGNVLKASLNGQQYVSKVKLDPNAQPHPTADFMVTEAPDDTAGKTVLAIYEIDGDTLKVCFALPGVTTRPAEFKRVEDESVFFQLKRAK